MSFKFNPTTGQLDLVGSETLKEKILNAPDVVRTITTIDAGTCSERISQIEYTAVSVSPTATATKFLTYSNTGFEYIIAATNWAVVP